jgi:hypothetical protein
MASITSSRETAICAKPTCAMRRRTSALGRIDPFAAVPAKDRSLRIVLKNSEIEPSRKSRFRARRVTSSDSPYAMACGRVGGIDTIFDLDHDRSAAWVRERRTSGSARTSRESSLGAVTVGIRIQKPSNGEAINATAETSSAPSTPMTFAMLPHIQLPRAMPPVMAA